MGSLQQDKAAGSPWCTAHRAWDHGHGEEQPVSHLGRENSFPPCPNSINCVSRARPLATPVCQQPALSSQVAQNYMKIYSSTT